LNRPHYWGEDRVFFYNPSSHLRSIPTQWTSLTTPEPFVAVADGRAFFRAEDLALLADLVEKLDAWTEGS
jgi:hypothetical protein